MLVSMRIGGASFNTIFLTLALLAGLPASAEVLQARVKSVRTGAGSLLDVQLRLDWPQGASEGRLRLQAGSVQLPSLSWKGQKVDWQCPLRRVGSDGWRCDGVVRLPGAPARRLAVGYTPRVTQADLVAGSSRLRYRSLANAPGRHDIHIEQIPVAWLEAFLRGLWAEGHWSDGKLSGDIAFIAPDKGPFEVRSDLRVASLGLETPDGLLAAAGLQGRLRINYLEKGPVRSVDTRLDLGGGELLYQMLYTKFPATPVAIHIAARREGAAPWRLPQIEWTDPGVLSATGSAAFDAKDEISDLDLALAMPSLATARDRYLSGVLAPAGFPDIILGGALSADVHMSGGHFSGFRTQLAGVNAVDAKARFTFAGIAGDLAWTQGATATGSQLSWQSGALFGIGLGPAHFDFNSAGGELKLKAPVLIDALEGKLRLEHLAWQAPKAEAGARFQFGLGVEALDLASLSQRLGWPPFTGTVTGSLPSARYADDVLDFDGGLQMRLFGGTIELGELSMERPFGTAPTLSSNVRIEDLDLEPLTKVFGFGAITGRLDGHINQLRLVNWSPAAFEARLETDPAYTGKKRISQRAVNDISSVGGSGLVGGLQAKALQIFDDFGYDKIGMGCRLSENVCTMDGVGSAGEGYIIVKGAGLPRIQVVGFRRRVNWPTLVARLRAATAGQAPVIE